MRVTKAKLLFAFILLRCPKKSARFYRLIFFDRGHSSRSLFPPQAAVALVPLEGKVAAARPSDEGDQSKTTFSKKDTAEFAVSFVGVRFPL